MSFCQQVQGEKRKPSVKKIPCSIYAILSLLMMSATVDAATHTLEEVWENRAEIATQLIQPIRACIRRTDIVNGDSAAFHGCYDWHSAVHGVLATLIYMRLTGDSSDEAFVLSLLSPENIAAERNDLDRLGRLGSGIENPYGFAWFLWLAEEFSARYDDRLDGMADDIAKRILDAFNETPPTAFSRDYRNSAWALLALRQHAVVKNRQDWLADIDFLTKKHFPIESCHLDVRSSFMAACVNWAWLLTDVYGEDLGTTILDIEVLTPLENPASAHSHGLNFSRSWGLAELYRSTGSKAYSEKFADHFLATFNRPSHWNGPYDRVGHWVAQFGMFALSRAGLDHRSGHR